MEATEGTSSIHRRAASRLCADTNEIGELAGELAKGSTAPFTVSTLEELRGRRAEQSARDNEAVLKHSILERARKMYDTCRAWDSESNPVSFPLNTDPDPAWAKDK